MTSETSNFNYNYQSDQQVSEDNFDLKRYLSLFISNWYWFAISLLIAFSISYGINRWSEDIYTVSSSLLIRDDDNTALTNIFPGSPAYKSPQNLRNEMGILKSYNLNYRVMNELPDFNVNYINVGKRGIAETRMYRNTPFKVKYGSLFNQNLGKKVEIKILSETAYKLMIDGKTDFEKEMVFGEPFRQMGFDFTVELRDKENFKYNPNSSNRYYFFFESNSSLANQYRSKLTITPSQEESSLIILSVTGFVPEKEADYLNKLMDTYLRFGLEYKNQTTDQTIDFIEEQIGKISDSLKIAEQDLESFKLSNQILDISNEGKIMQEKIEKLDFDRTELIVRDDYLDYLKDYLNAKLETEEIISPAVLGIADQQLVTLVNALAEKQQALRQFSVNIDKNTEVYRLNLKEVEIIRTSLSEYLAESKKLINASLADIEKNTEQVRSNFLKLPVVERQLINIQRNYNISNTVYTYLLEKKAEAGIARASNVSDHRKIDMAGPATSSRIKPKEKQNNLMAFIFGMGVPFLIIILIDLLNNKIIDRRDIEKYTKVPILGFISHNNLHSELPVVEKPGSTMSESFRSVRTNLKFFIKTKDNPVISVSSTITAEGKTFISANLASILALSGKKVLLVGLDLRKPRIHRLFNMRNDTGLTNYLIGQIKYEEVFKKTEVDNLWYATSGPVPPNPAELVESDAMHEFIERAKKDFDYVVIDTPPVAIVTDALLCASFTDFYIFVVRQRYSSKSTLELIDELRNNENLKSMGIVVNDISLSGYYGYGLRYGYYLGYGYSYGYNYYGNYADRMYGYSGSSKNYYTED